MPASTSRAHLKPVKKNYVINFKRKRKYTRAAPSGLRPVKESPTMSPTVCASRLAMDSPCGLSRDVVP